MSRCVEAAWRALAQGDGNAAVHCLEDGCATQDADSLFTLGTWYLSGQVVGRDRPEAARLLRAAAALGQIEAALMDVALTANGSFGPPDWSAALDQLQTIAPRSSDARDQLRLLSLLDVDTAGHPRALLEGKSLSAVPSAKLFSKLVSAEECAMILRVGEPTMEPSIVVDSATGAQMQNAIRTSDGAVLAPARENLVIRAVEARIARATGTDIECGEPLSILRYRPGQEYKLHVDTFARTPNQRVKTAILYLNDGYDGGETMFAENGLKVAGTTGDVLVFDNVLADGRPDPASRHAGLPVTRGEKWVATRWIRERPYSPWSWKPGE